MNIICRRDKDTARALSGKEIKEETHFLLSKRYNSGEPLRVNGIMSL
jgi:hypothetical protein